MKQYLLKFSGAALLLSLLATGASAQEEKGDAKKTESSDLIIVRTKDGKNTKVTIEVKDGEVKVNGKPLSEFNDDNVTVTKRKEMQVTGSASRSRFRNGSAWSYSGDDMAPLTVQGSPRAFLGVSTEKVSDGAKITDVSNESAAEKAGLKEGDIITRVNDQKISSPEDLTKAIAKYKPEEKVTVVYKRDGKEKNESIALGKRKDTNISFAPGNFNFDRVYSYNGGHGRLGIKAQETEEGKGLKVLDVDDESTAEKAGIKEGDVITEFDGTEVNNVDKLREAASKAAAKPSFKVKLLRDGKTEEIQVKIPKNLKTTNL